MINKQERDELSINNAKIKKKTRENDKVERIIENIIFYGLTIPLQLFQTIGVFIIAFYNNAFKELSFFLIGYFFTRAFLGETFHLNSTIKCTLATWIVFFLITYFIPSIEISIFLCIVLGTLLSIYMNYLAVGKKYA